MKTVSVCFSGHPRAILKYQVKWREFFDLIKTRYHLRVFFHSWSGTGLVKSVGDSSFAEGIYEPGRFQQFDELIGFLDPDDFTIEGTSSELERCISEFPSVLLNRNQAKKSGILSQLYSIETSDRLRREFDKKHGISDVVIKSRLDLVPYHFHLREIDYVSEHPDIPIIFVPSPRFHVHPGGGGGCGACQRFFRESASGIDHDGIFARFFRNHGVHENDVCDLHAIGGPEIMARYSSIYSSAAAIWSRVQRFQPSGVETLACQPDADNPKDFRVAQIPVDLEEQIHCFYPEKLIRFGIQDALLVDGDTTLAIARR